MAFFLVGRDRSDGSLQLLCANSFLAREDAMAALSGLIVAGDSDVLDVFVCNLDAAMPVLLVSHPAVSSGVEVIPETIEEPPVEPAETDAVLLEEPTAGVWEAPVVAPLELERMVTQESNPDVQTASEVAPADVEVSAEEAFEVEIPVPEPTVTEWPEMNTEQIEEEEPEVVPDVGEALEEESVCESAEVDAVLSEADDLSAAPDVAEQTAAEALIETEPAVSVIEEPPGYEPAELDFGNYTCDECIYGNTCPKSETSSPADCGSFQWKSV